MKKINSMKKILCWIGLHKFACNIQDLIDEFGFIPSDGRMPSNSKCKRCGKTFKSKL